MHRKQEIIASAFKISIFIAILIFSGIVMKEYSSQIGLFKTFDVHIRGNQFVTTSLIQKKIIPYINQSFLTLNLNDVQKNISSIDFIKTAQISQVLPNILIIQIIENHPIALITFENTNYLMDENDILLPADGTSISFFPVPIVTISNEINNIIEITGVVSGVFKYLLNDYDRFYDNLSEIIIAKEKWTFYSDNKTQIFTKSNNLFNQLNVLKNFEKTVYPNRLLKDYSYIDLRIGDQIVVKEKYRKG